jgi:hypothetical protein
VAESAPLQPAANVEPTGNDPILPCPNLRHKLTRCARGASYRIRVKSTMSMRLIRKQPQLCAEAPARIIGQPSSEVSMYSQTALIRTPRHGLAV